MRKLLNKLEIKLVVIATDVAAGIDFLKRTTPDVILKTETVFDIFIDN